MKALLDELLESLEEFHRKCVAVAKLDLSLVTLLDRRCRAIRGKCVALFASRPSTLNEWRI